VHPIFAHPTPAHSFPGLERDAAQLAAPGIARVAAQDAEPHSKVLDVLAVAPCAGAPKSAGSSGVWRKPFDA